jgi:lipoate-protein ligase A
MKSCEKKWLVIFSGQDSPAMNMALDSIMWERARKNPDIAILRFYAWVPPAVSLGAGQLPEKLVNVDFCQHHGIPIVRRVTGGSAIFHDIEITYSFSSVNDEVFPGPSASYEKICEAISTGVKNLGVQLSFRGLSTGREPSFTSRDCFSLSSRYDLVAGGRKFVGSAQRKDKNSFLQHGSILLNIRKHFWQGIFIQRPDFEKISCLSDFVMVPLIDVILEQLAAGFEEYFGTKFTPDGFTRQEIDGARKLAPSFLLSCQKV